MKNPWIEAMRLRTLPVSVAGVIAGTACALFFRSFQWIPALCCLLFALGAQIASNFANEYFDFRNGLDRKGREGFRRGVTEGDISPGAMLRATLLTLLLAAIPGCILILWGGWWMLLVGIVVAIFALAYSAGPYPLSHHGLGDLAVIIFFGLLPVTLTAWLQVESTAVVPMALTVGLGVGMLAANVLIVNNYRDADDDRAVGKHTTVVLFGRPAMARVYLMFVIVGCAVMCAPAWWMGAIWQFPIVAIIPGIRVWRKMIVASGAELNDILRRTAMTLLLASAILLLESLLSII